MTMCNLKGATEFVNPLESINTAAIDFECRYSLIRFILSTCVVACDVDL